ncbi:unnamed protein product [Miscanthus lutarioriparius]|uniref:DUF6598 domain-containing protein n=1 Tax=Miscanthus lutarioriparius TaxID=422564 RepID=A0A811Q032_9POAL|nr:unnamed protein product [Miscanthus lutarioriparius]
MGIETPSIQAVVAANGGPTPSPKEDGMARLGAEAKDEMVALHAAEKAARAEEEEDVDDYYLAEADDNEADAREFRDTWNRLFSGVYGCFEDTTKIPNKRFTFKKPKWRDAAGLPTTLQIFSLKVAWIRGGLQWPLHVFGMVAIRDSVDQNRNMIFDRSRDNCQILTQEVPYLKLTGPSRAVEFSDPPTFEVDLKVKGATESNDRCLSFLAITYINYEGVHSRHLTREYHSRLSTLEFALDSMSFSVEATIALRITSGEWPSGFRLKFTASTTSISCAKVILLDSGDDKVSVVGHGRNIKLSRSVVSVVRLVELLKVCAKALQGDHIVAGRRMLFKPQKDGVSVGTLRLGFCTLGVTIYWSLIGY